MPELDIVQIMAMPATIAILYAAYKLLWGRLMDSANANSTDQRVTSGLITQLVAERDRAVARADAAEEKADANFKRLSEVEAQLRIMTYQLEALQASNLYLKKRINELIGGEHEGHTGEV